MPTDLPSALAAHIALAASALLLGAVIGLPLGVYAAYTSKLHAAILAIAGMGRTLPSLALLAFMLPFLGVGFVPAVAALTILAVPPIVIATDSGLRGVSPAALDAARGMGMNTRQIFFRIRWPLALAPVFDGLRIAAIEVIASATLATFIGAGGLGDIIVRGLQTNDDALLYWGAITVAILALAVEGLGSLLTYRRRIA